MWNEEVQRMLGFHAQEGSFAISCWILVALQGTEEVCCLLSYSSTGEVKLDLFPKPSCLACGQRKHSGCWVFMHRRARLRSPHARVWLPCMETADINAVDVKPHMHGRGES